ncbi:MAG: GNAT family N-acetyltransferase [Oscillospiraceae bacterium]|jgi:ribosomal protein S18 acetylase RimI-like enzyme|nr:GNAT family N-acetyltransferase [Oscillospiraceae bacterium]
MQTDTPQFTPLNVDEHLEFCAAAHRETYRLTFGREIPDAYLGAELARMRRHFADAPDSILLASLNGAAVGLLRLERRVVYGDAASGWVNCFYVAPEWRGRGLGRQLAAFAAAYFARYGIREIFLRAGEPNGAAIGFYTHIGFARAPFGDKTADGVKSLMFKKVCSSGSS